MGVRRVGRKAFGHCVGVRTCDAFVQALTQTDSSGRECVAVPPRCRIMMTPMLVRLLSRSTLSLPGACKPGGGRSLAILRRAMGRPARSRTKSS